MGLKIFQIWIRDFGNLVQGVDELEYNIQSLMDKTVLDLAVVVVDMAEYIDDADHAKRFSRAIDGISAVISYLGFVKKYV